MEIYKPFQSKYVVKRFSKMDNRAFWDTDGRFIWLKNSEKNNINVIHIPRDIYRHVFDYLFYSRGYMQDWTKGELPLTTFMKKIFLKKEKYILNIVIK